MSATTSRSRRASLVAVAIVAVLVATVGVRTGLDQKPGSAQGTVEPIDWQPCNPAPFECAVYAVPLDHDDPSGPQIDLSVLRHPATGAPEDRKGSLFVNPGGPGGDGLSFAVVAAQIMSPDVVAAFDIVGLNPRGVQGLEPGIACPGLLEDDPEAGKPTDWSSYFAGKVPQQAAALTACQVSLARTAAFYGTAQVARDLDLLRRAVGDDGLTYWGGSYGTRIGEVYAQYFPDRIRAMVLDGNVDPSSTALTFLEARGGSFDDALGLFYATYPGTEAVVAGIEADLEAGGPITAKDEATGEPLPLDATTFLPIVAEGYLGNERGWPAIDANIAAVRAQLDGGPVAEIFGIESETDNGNTVLTQVNCLDLPGRPTAEQMAGTAAAMEVAGPVFGWTQAQGLAMCAGFPLPPDPAPATPPSSLPPILLLASEHDPATPYVWSTAMLDFLPGSVRVTYEGAQHVVWNTVGSACIDDLANAYVLEGAVPANGTTCPFVDPSGGPVPDPDDLDLIPDPTPDF